MALRFARAGTAALVAATMMGLAQPAQAQNAAPAECKTPMPKDVKIDAPAAGLSADQARLLGIWNGVWQDGTCAILAVQGIDPAGNMKLIYANPDYRTSGSSGVSAAVAANAQELAGKFENGTITTTTTRGNRIMFVVNGDKLSASATLRNGTWQGTFTKP